MGSSKPALARRAVSRGRIIIAGLLVIILALTAVFGISAYVGWNLTHPARQALDANPGTLGLKYQDIVFKSRVDGLTLQGWLIPAVGSRKTVIFAHGYGENRLNNGVPILPIAKHLADTGYNVLMFDFRGHGESEGNLTSVGQYEVRDLLGAIDYVAAQPGLNEQIILFGFSMGASTAIMAASREPAVAAVIADSPFADLKAYLGENLSVWSGLPAFPFSRAFFIVTPLITGLKPGSVSPQGEIPLMNGRPLLLIHGDQDVDIPIANSESLLRAYPEAKLIRFPGGTHVKNYQTNPVLYLEIVDTFLDSVKPYAASQ
jgi:pimeloyl-ACP methyl ester carboxylesterase